MILAEGHGVVVEGVAPGNPTDGKLERGDVIVEVNQAPSRGLPRW